ncbi:M48 family metallopeptidase [Segatella oris]|uniref:M48 family metallopeptidase n=1 Tax=Segatella oris TaxID=28135 RepID=UPI0028E4CDC9|nr:M48 family metallopeptidase [Segatella oris]
MKNVKSLMLILGTSLLIAACGTTQTVPVTGRKHSLLVSDAQVLSLSKEEYSKYMRSAKLSANAANTAMVQRVGRRLASAVESYLRNNGAADEIKNFSWEFNLVADKNVNAFCMPGGKIVVYEGLLPVTQDEASLAIVLGHEIAHAVAKHSAEQMSKKIRQSYGTQIGSQILGAIAGQSVGDLAGAVAQQGFSFANLRYSRDNETEADHIGLIFAAMAGYNPQVAVPFWKRMAALSGNSNQSDMFSDHPSDAKRIAAIQQWMPTAMKYYEASGYASKSVPSVKLNPAKKKASHRRR